MVVLGIDNRGKNVGSRPVFRDVSNIAQNANDGPVKGQVVLPKKRSSAAMLPTRGTLPLHKKTRISKSPGLKLTFVGSRSKTETSSRHFGGVQPKKPCVASIAESKLALSSPSSPDYVEDMYKNFRQTERTIVPYMTSQSRIDSGMRSVVVGWLLEVSETYDLCSETIFLTVDIMDRFLVRQDLRRSHFQLLGATSLMIACKYEQRHAPSPGFLVAISEKCFVERDVLEMETIILTTLGYRITIPSPHSFLVHFLTAAHADEATAKLAGFILKQTLKSYRLRCQYRPSQLAAAAVFLARQHVTNSHSDWATWTFPLLLASDYSVSEAAGAAKSVMASRYFSLPAMCTVSASISTKDGESVRLPGMKVMKCDF